MENSDRSIPDQLSPRLIGSCVCQSAVWPQKEAIGVPWAGLHERLDIFRRLHHRVDVKLCSEQAEVDNRMYECGSGV